MTLVVLGFIGGGVYAYKMTLDQKDRQLLQQKDLDEKKLNQEKELKEYEQQQINQRQRLNPYTRF